MRRRIFVLAILGAAVLLAFGSSGRAASAKLARKIIEYINTDAGSDREAVAKQAILDMKPKPEDIAEAFSGRKLKKYKQIEIEEVDVPGTEKYYSIIIPRGYNGRKKFPMVVCLHGGGSTSGKGYEGWWWVHGQLQDYLVMAPTVGQSHWWKPQEKKILLREIRHALLNFAVDPDRVCRGGFPTGGAGTGAIGRRHPHHCAALGPAAGAPRGETGADMDTRLFENLTNTYMLIQHGSKDNPEVSRLAEHRLKKIPGMKDRFKYIEYEGVGHEHPMGKKIEYKSIMDGKRKSLTQAQDAADFAKFIKKKKRTPLPKEVIFITKGPNDLESYWFDVEAATYVARVEARAEGNEIRLTTKNIAAITVYLHPKLVDMGKQVKIIIDKKEVFRGIPQKSIETALETLKRDCDASRVFLWKKRFDLTSGGEKEKPDGEKKNSG
ncbi:MAG: hypothetical protein E3J72_01210 [Planctomycetota bacterium]|nr:MAG: hypothetical protein E3J72_01210 [Planctomycetota bacterium]